MKALIKKVSKGKQKGQFRFVLIGKNGQVIATSGTENYTQKHSCIETLEANFPQFKIVDTTVKQKSVTVKEAFTPPKIKLDHYGK